MKRGNLDQRLDEWELPQTPESPRPTFTQEADSPDNDPCSSNLSSLSKRLASAFPDFRAKGRFLDFSQCDAMEDPHPNIEEEAVPLPLDVQEECSEVADTPRISPQKCCYQVSQRPKRRRSSVARPYLNEGYKYDKEGLQGVVVEDVTPSKRRLVVTPFEPGVTERGNEGKETKVVRYKELEWREEGDLGVKCYPVVESEEYTAHYFILPPSARLDYAVPAAHIIHGQVVSCHSKFPICLTTPTSHSLLHKYDSFQVTSGSFTLLNSKSRPSQVYISSTLCA